MRIQNKDKARLQVLDRSMKANFEVRITDKKHGGSTTLAVWAENISKEEIRDLLSSALLDWQEEMGGEVK